MTNNKNKQTRDFKPTQQQQNNNFNYVNAKQINNETFSLVLANFAHLTL